MKKSEEEEEKNSDKGSRRRNLSWGEEKEPQENEDPEVEPD